MLCWQIMLKDSSSMINHCYFSCWQKKKNEQQSMQGKLRWGRGESEALRGILVLMGQKTDSWRRRGFITTSELPMQWIFSSVFRVGAVFVPPFVITVYLVYFMSGFARLYMTYFWYQVLFSIWFQLLIVLPQCRWDYQLIIVAPPSKTTITKQHLLNLWTATK